MFCPQFSHAVAIASILWLTCSQSDSNAQQDGQIKVEKELAQYVNNATAFKKYSCAVSVEQIRDDTKSRENSSFVEFNLIRSWNAERSLVRLDSFEKHATGRFNPVTTVLLKDKVLQNSYVRPVQIAGLTDANNVRWAALSECVVFDPFLLPLTELDTLRPMSVDKDAWRQPDVNISHFRETSRVEIVDFVTVKYCVSSKYSIFKEVKFDRKLGGMPVQVDITLETNGKSTRVGLIHTDWKSRGPNFYPTRVDSKRELVPGVSSHVLARLHWDWDNLDSVTFELENAKCPPCSVLWDQVVSQ